MAEYIEKQAATTIPGLPKEHREYQTFNLDDAFEAGWYELQRCIEEIPPADVRPVVRGKWIEWWPSDCALIMTGEEMLWMCSECTAKLSDQSSFCPNCGADMRGGDAK